MNKECKDEAIKFEKGELRIGVFVTIGEHQNWHWKHWGCTTPQVIANINEAIEGDTDLFDGYDELPEEEQTRVSQALEQGHVADEDWKGVRCPVDRAQEYLLTRLGHRSQSTWPKGVSKCSHESSAKAGEERGTDSMLTAIVLLRDD